MRLVNDLSFEVHSGGSQAQQSSLLIVGHNGAGKSSIFRCLGGLWDIPTGRITKPGGESGLHTEVFYLPQKPYQVLGTLLDQITYPETGATNGISTDELHGILAEFQLEYLLERPGVLTDEINWEEELSLGEKQRLAMARLMYQKPRFAILDECTSAVSTAMERRLCLLSLSGGGPIHPAKSTRADLAQGVTAIVHTAWQRTRSCFPCGQVRRGRSAGDLVRDDLTPGDAARVPRPVPCDWGWQAGLHPHADR